MKTPILVVLFALAGSALPGSAHAADARFAEAESLAKKKETAAAADLYRALLKDGLDGAGLRYNLGTLALDEGKIGEAVLHLRAARRLAPRDADVKHNLAVALDARTDRLAGDTVVDPLFALGEALPPTWARLALALPLAILALLIAALSVVRGRGRRAMAISAAVCAVIVVGGGVLWVARRQVEGTREAVVLAEETPALKSPEADAAQTFLAHAGLYGRVMEESGEFVRLRFENGLEAWIAVRDVGILD